MVFTKSIVVGRKTIALVYLRVCEINKAQKTALFKIKNMRNFILLIIVCTSACAQKRTPESMDIPSKIKMVADREPREPMIISGTIYLPDGKTPAKDAILSVWHTDTKGYYIEGGGGAGEVHPRIHGRIKTSSDGKYEFSTIKPAPYPSNSAPAHVHGHLSPPGFPEYPLIYYFEGDNLITDKNRSELNSHRGGTPSI